MDIYIPTYGRSTRQVTWQGLPLDLQRRTLLVVQKREELKYIAMPIAVLPDDIRTIAATREYIVHKLHPKLGTSDKLVMLDDDLKFQVRREDDRGKFLEANVKDKITLFSEIAAMLESYAHVGVVAREGGNRMLEDGECCRMMRVLAYYAPTLHKNKISFLRHGPKFTLEDFDATLQLLSKGYPNLVLHRWCQGQGTSNESGGCSSYRTLALHNKNAQLLAGAWPEFVRAVRKTTKTAWGGATRTDVMVQWKKAFASAPGCAR